MEIRLHPSQSKVFKDTSRFKVIRAGRRWGKSYLSITLLLYQAGQLKGNYWFVSPTYKQSKEIAWQLLTNLIPDGWCIAKNETDLSMTLKNNSVIKLKGADNPDSLRGVGLSGVILDEYAFMRPNVWEEIIRPMLFDSGGWAIFISTPDGYNHFYKLWENATKDNWSRFHFTTYDNPHIKKEEIDETKLSMSDERFHQEVLAEFTKKTGAIWPSFSRDNHIVPKRNPDKQNQQIISIDFGFAIDHPTAVGLFEFNSLGDVCLIDGFIQSGLNLSRIIELIHNLSTGLVVRRYYADSARPDLISELKKAGFPVIEASKDVELGIAKVDEYMQVSPLTNKPRLTICDHLTEAIRQVENYQWEEIRLEDGTFKNKPKKQDDDMPDAIRYALYTHLFVPKSNKRIVGYTGGDPITGFGRRPVFRKSIDDL